MASDLITGFLSCAALIVAIGTQNAFVLRQGIRGEHVLPIVLVCAIADALLIASGVAGLGALIEAAPATLSIARYGGAAFLIAYGLFAARRAMRSTGFSVEAGAGVSLSTALATCLGFTFLNPHVYLDTVILLGALAGQHGTSGRWWFGAGAMMASCLWFIALGYGARLLTPLFRKPVAWRVLDGLVALTMLGLGTTLAVR